MFAAAWCRTVWTLLLVFTAAVLLVAVLRKPSRKAFGAERAFLLWLLPALAMPASLLPACRGDRRVVAADRAEDYQPAERFIRCGCRCSRLAHLGGGALACGCRHRVVAGRVRATALSREIARSGCVRDGSSTLAGHARE
jgi:hypothetical protein